MVASVGNICRFKDMRLGGFSPMGKPLAGEMWVLQQLNDPIVSFRLVFDRPVTGFPKCSRQQC